MVSTRWIRAQTSAATSRVIVPIPVLRLCQIRAFVTGFKIRSPFLRPCQASSAGASMKHTASLSWMSAVSQVRATGPPFCRGLLDRLVRHPEPRLHLDAVGDGARRRLMVDLHFVRLEETASSANSVRLAVDAALLMVEDHGAPFGRVAP